MDLCSLLPTWTYAHFCHMDLCSLLPTNFFLRKAIVSKLILYVGGDFLLLNMKLRHFLGVRVEGVIGWEEGWGEARMGRRLEVLIKDNKG